MQSFGHEGEMPKQFARQSCKPAHDVFSAHAVSWVQHAVRRQASHVVPAVADSPQLLPQGLAQFCRRQERRRMSVSGSE